jgi:hypothetical protein
VVVEKVILPEAERLARAAKLRDFLVAVTLGEPEASRVVAKQVMLAVRALSILRNQDDLVPEERRFGFSCRYLSHRHV